MARVIVVVEGGVVQNILYDDQAIEVVVIDYDVDGVYEEHLTKIGNSRAAVIGMDRRGFSPNKVDEIFKQIDV